MRGPGGDEVVLVESTRASGGRLLVWRSAKKAATGHEAVERGRDGLSGVVESKGT